jgi:GNAT superfamily N-acetyltransferase
MADNEGVLASLTIRAATPDDRRFALRLADRLADFDVPPWRTRQEIVAGDRRALEHWFDHSDAGGEAMLVAEWDGKPVGIAYVLTLIDYFTGKPHGHVSVLAVAKEAEGRGVGTALLGAAEAWSRARGFDRLTLMVFEANNRARRVYERNAFQPEIRRYLRLL